MIFMEQPFNDRSSMWRWSGLLAKRSTGLVFRGKPDMEMLSCWDVKRCWILKSLDSYLYLFFFRCWIVFGLLLKRLEVDGKRHNIMQFVTGRCSFTRFADSSFALASNLQHGFPKWMDKGKPMNKSITAWSQRQITDTFPYILGPSWRCHFSLLNNSDHLCRKTFVCTPP